MIDLACVKQHLRIDGDYDDQYIKSLIPVARSYSEHYCDRRIYDTPQEANADPNQDKAPIVATPDLEQAELLAIGHWYATREAVNVNGTSTEVPITTKVILDFYRRKTL